MQGTAAKPQQPAQRKPGVLPPSPKTGYAFTAEDMAKAHATRKARAAARRAAKLSLLEAYEQETERSSLGIARAMVAKAKEGDVAAAKELADRIYGRAVSRLEVAHTDPLVELDMGEARDLLEALRGLREARAAATVEGEIVGEIVSQAGVECD